MKWGKRNVWQQNHNKNEKMKIFLIEKIKKIFSIEFSFWLHKTTFNDKLKERSGLFSETFQSFKLS